MAGRAGASAAAPAGEGIQRRGRRGGGDEHLGAWNGVKGSCTRLGAQRLCTRYLEATSNILQAGEKAGESSTIVKDAVQASQATGMVVGWWLAPGADLDGVVCACRVGLDGGPVAGVQRLDPHQQRGRQQLAAPQQRALRAVLVLVLQVQEVGLWYSTRRRTYNAAQRCAHERQPVQCVW